ncbi:hypothetical protein H2204_000121 [Knufia peltigerae]|uniref:Peptidase A1 domain-containing protein n=1 Tax=Knufia peltigerae TaxID=1002370 RepID=A0AA38YFB8_9EURO|nr:hypothetical protein H2204_000121 [Knufia peltigerae]
MHSSNFRTPIVLVGLSVLTVFVASIPLSSISKTTETPSSPKTLRLPIRRQVSSHAKRSNVLSSTLHNEEWDYLIDVKVGTPPQSLSIVLDTGSSDTWVFSPEACSSDANCAASFDPSDSSTFDEASPGSFAITYNDHSHVEGDYFTDNIGVGGATISSLMMGLANTGQLSASTTSSGLMGVGYRANEAVANVDPANVYPNMVYEMVSQDIIGSYSYSLWLDDLAASTGTILFGGYDPSKFQGSLTMMPTLPDPTKSDGVISSFLVSMISLGAMYNGKTTTFTSSTFNGAALLDSGTTNIFVPSAIYAELANYFGADENQVVDCKLSQTKGYVSFGFVDATIQVPFSELALLDSTTGLCQLGFFDAGEQLILGDTFLRSAYVYYDLGNNEIGLAQTVF